MNGPTNPTLPRRPIKCWADVMLTPIEIALIEKWICADALPPEPPADLMPAYRAAVYRLMSGDKTAWAKIHELRAEEHARGAK